MTDAAPTYLYRVYDAHEVLLYVGVSDAPRARLKVHAREKGWWGEVESVTVERYATRALALAAEAEEIRTLNPVHNITHSLINAKAAPMDRKSLADGARVVKVSVERDGHWWVFEIPEFRTGGQARSLAQVDDEAQGIAAAWLDIAPGVVAVDMTVVGAERVLDEWATAAQDEEAARQAQARAADRKRTVVRGLRDQHYTAAEVAALLSISKQRVYQLEKPASGAGEKIAS